MAIHKENIKPTKRNLICNNAFRLFVEFMCMFMQKQNKFLDYNYNININIFMRSVNAVSVDRKFQSEIISNCIETFINELTCE